MIKKLVIASLFAASALGAYSVVAKNASPAPLTNKMEAYLVQLNQQGKEVLVRTNTAAPGDMLEYHLTYSNVSKQDLDGLVVTGPVPANTKYVGQSASLAQGANFVVSIDGGETFEREPVKRMVVDAQGRKKQVIISPEKYTHVRWNLNTALKSGMQNTYFYRVAVK